MSDIVGIDGNSFKPEDEEEAPPPCEELVETLKTLLADALCGDMRSMVVVTRHMGDSLLGKYESKYAGDYQEPVPHLVLGLCDDVKQEFMETFILAPRYANMEEEE